ncbi:MAG TPA: phosphoglycerate dehydrogenase [Candidatus Methylomirabilis sp.]|nr:phosphoglycerate dehydrogenase [Candidatus Methylomirabilis sp.]
MGKPRVLITSIFLRPGDEVDRRLREAGLEPVYHPLTGRRTEEELIDLLRGVEGVIVSMDPFTARVLATAPQLKVISRTGVGYDAVDLAAATAQGILVTTTPGVNRHAVAELAMALMLCCARRMGENLAEVRRGGWTRHEGVDLAGKTLGIVGLGTIGKEVAQRAHAFEMRILAHDLVQDLQFAEALRIGYAPLDHLLRESDFVSLHLFLTDATRHLINAERLALMKPTAFLINTARGGIVDTAALCRALQEKRIAGAALDVVEGEPLAADSPLRDLDNVYLTPHVGGATADARRHAGAMAAENLIRALRGECPQGLVNPQVLPR